MKIETGQGSIPLITLLGIWSISALNALPGLAVSPILGQMSTIFPHSSEFDIQLLSSLPSLLTIPFILLSGKLTERINNIVLLQVGLIIFALSGLLYMLSSRMWQLIAVSALLGIGSGMIVPLSTGLISLAGAGRPAYDIIEEQLSGQPAEVRHLVKSINDSLKAGKEVSNIPMGLMALFRPSVQPYLIS